MASSGIEWTRQTSQLRLCESINHFLSFAPLDVARDVGKKGQLNEASSWSFHLLIDVFNAVEILKLGEKRKTIGCHRLGRLESSVGSKPLKKQFGRQSRKKRHKFCFVFGFANIRARKNDSCLRIGICRNVIPRLHLLTGPQHFLLLFNFHDVLPRALIPFISAGS